MKIIYQLVLLIAPMILPLTCHAVRLEPIPAARLTMKGYTYDRINRQWVLFKIPITQKELREFLAPEILVNLKETEYLVLSEPKFTIEAFKKPEVMADIYTGTPPQKKALEQLRQQGDRPAVKESVEGRY